VVEAQEAARRALAAPDRATFLAAMAERQQLALAAIEPHFDVPAAVRRLEVREAPPGGPPGGAYYSPPSEDLSRPGTLWCSFGDNVGPFPLYDQVATAYHEGFPGHHLQCGVAATLTSDLCRLQRVLARYSGAAEGWALYAERLMAELGGYERPEYELGRLTNELVRACRVVFDIGAHLELPIPAHAPFHPGEPWSYALGVEFFRDLAGLPQERAESEVTRYLGWPAQAISYKVGERVILGLRADWLAARGAGSLREFHGRVLACGNVGLDVLRGQVLAEVT
jgi:uncharacterized protein (DUF885 family)